MIFFQPSAAVFGGANLAGIMSAQARQWCVLCSAGACNNAAITPMIMKLGGGILNRFAGIVNDPATKGLWTKTKQRARDAGKILQIDELMAIKNSKGLATLHSSRHRS